MGPIATAVAATAGAYAAHRVVDEIGASRWEQPEPGRGDAAFDRAARDIHLATALVGATAALGFAAGSIALRRAPELARVAMGGAAIGGAGTGAWNLFSAREASREPSGPTDGPAVPNLHPDD